MHVESTRSSKSQSFELYESEASIHNSMKNVQTAREANVESDYNFPVGNDRTRLEKIVKLQKVKSS